MSDLAEYVRELESLRETRRGPGPYQVSDEDLIGAYGRRLITGGKPTSGRLANPMRACRAIVSYA